MTVSRYRAGEMDCPAEEQLVRMRLAELDRIDRVAVDLGRREVTVEHRLDTDVVTSALGGRSMGLIADASGYLQLGLAVIGLVEVIRRVVVAPAVIVAAIAVAITGSAIPDLVAGAAIFVIVANGARQILRLSR